MKTILITAYAINPYKGSEDGMGWNYIYQAARRHHVIAVTRKNNRQHIESFINTNRTNDPETYARLNFLYFDWPAMLLFWKKGPMLSMIYYYCWQLTLAVWLQRKKIDFDIVHNLNFHNDWTPSFLWLLGKKFIWGPVGHHPKIPIQFLEPYGRKEIVKDRLLWLLKNSFWTMDPFLKMSRKKAASIWCMHQQSAKKLNAGDGHYFIHPSIAAANATATAAAKGKPQFIVLSVGRYVPLKGFDVTIRSFAAFYKKTNTEDRQKLKLILVGKGPFKAKLVKLAADEGIASVTEFIDWMPQAQLNELYSSASVFLYPSHEGAGMVVAEAMSRNLPVVCWNNAGPGNIVHTHSTLKVPYTSYALGVRYFAEKLSQLFTDPGIYARESLLATERFATSLSWDVKAAQLELFYALNAVA